MKSDPAPTPEKPAPPALANHPPVVPGEGSPAGPRSQPVPEPTPLAPPPVPGSAEHISLVEISTLRELILVMLQQRQAAALPLGTLELLLAKIFHAAMEVEPARLMDHPDFSLGDYVKLLNACARLADALVKVELLRARLPAGGEPLPAGLAEVIPTEVMEAVEKQLRLM